MNEYAKRVLTAMVSKTREACAGSNVQDNGTVVKYIYEALEYSAQVDAGKVIIGMLNETLKIMSNATDYNSRLPADNVLCEILNKELKG